MTTQPHVLMYSTGVCPYCVRAENLLKARGVTDIEKIRVDLDPSRLTEMMERTSRRTVPQIFIVDTQVSGYNNKKDIDQAGKLLTLLAGTPD